MAYPFRLAYLPGKVIPDFRVGCVQQQALILLIYGYLRREAFIQRNDRLPILNGHINIRDDVRNLSGSGQKASGFWIACPDAPAIAFCFGNSDPEASGKRRDFISGNGFQAFIQDGKQGRRDLAFCLKLDQKAFSEIPRADPQRLQGLKISQHRFQQ